MPLGQFIGTTFFVLVLLAALTSSISLMETIVSMFVDRFHWSRTKSVLVIYVISLLLGVPSSLGHGIWSGVLVLGMDFLTFFDYLSNSVMMPILAISTCILVGWMIGTKSVKEEITKNGEKFSRGKIYDIMIKYISPVFLFIILIFFSLVQFGFIKY